jgi:hypothetical protein
MTMTMTRRFGVLPAMLLAIPAAIAACGDDATSSPLPAVDGGATDSATDAPGVGPGVKGGFQITVSGEDLAVNGYDFGADSRAEGDPPAFVDGWEVRFRHVIVTVDKIRINADPDKDEGDPTVMGDVVASVDGPFAVDTTIGGDIVGKSGSPDEKTIAIATIDKRTSGEAFDPAQRYAFSYDFVAASAAAKPVNLDAEGSALYEEAKAKGWAMIFEGSATYKGSAPAAGSVFEKIPREVRFKLGLTNPSSYINCANTDLNQLASGEYPRGIQVSADKVTVAQITIHTDHLFWSKLNVEGTELHFDPIAAIASTYGTPDAGPGEVTIEDLAAVDVTGFKTRAGEPLPGRSLVPDYSAPAGQLAFDPNGTTFASANSFAAYLAYTASSGGHLNEVGECTVKNNFTP